MKIKIGDNQGYVIVDDTTGKILSVSVNNVVEGKFDALAFSSYSNNSDGTHTCVYNSGRKRDLQLNRFNFVMISKQRFSNYLPKILLNICFKNIFHNRKQYVNTLIYTQGSTNTAQIVISS